jgi:hypothetical protein
LQHTVFCTQFVAGRWSRQQQIGYRKPYAAIHGLVLLIMGVKPETCRTKGTSINYTCCFKLVSHIISFKIMLAHFAVLGLTHVTRSDCVMLLLCNLHYIPLRFVMPSFFSHSISFAVTNEISSQDSNDKGPILHSSL